MKPSLGIVLIAAVAFGAAGCGKKSASSDLPLAMSASPPGVVAHPGFVVVIPNGSESSFVVVRLDERKVAPLERVDLGKPHDGDPVRVVLMDRTTAFTAVAGRVWYNRGGGMVSVWIEDALFVDPHGHEIVVPRRDAQNVPVRPPA